MSYGGYGKPDPYSDYMSGGSYGGAGQGMAQAAGASMLPVAGLGLNVLGTAIGGYGAYKQYRQAERQRREEQRRYEEQKQIAEMERRKAEEQQRMQNQLGYGGYARTMQDQRTAPYQGYAARIGL